MLKRFMDLFFDIEEEVIEESKMPIEEPSSRQRNQQRDAPQSAASAKIESEIAERPNDGSKQHEEIAAESVEAKKSIFIDTLSTSPEAKKSAAFKPTETTSHTTTNYEFTPIISPMFGVDEKSLIKHVVPIVERMELKNDSVIGTIISPIYGVETRQRIKPSVQNDIIDDQIVNLSLDEIIRPEPEKRAIPKELINDQNDLFNVEEMQGMPEEEQPSETTEDIESPCPIELARDGELVTQRDSFEQDTEKYLSEEEIFESEDQPSLFDFMIR